MTVLFEIGQEIAASRRRHGFRQVDLAARAGLSRATIDALENGRASDIGFSKLNRLLAVLGMELAMRPATGNRPTLDQLLEENSND